MGTVSWTYLLRRLPPPLSSWFAELESDSLHIVGTRDEIARRNAWSFCLSKEERQLLGPGQVAAFLEAAAQMWADRLSGKPGGPWIFYAWHDEAAGALRFSLVPGRPGSQLPFSAEVEILDAPSMVCEAFLSGSDVIPWSALQESDSQPDNTDFVQRVFTRELGGGSRPGLVSRRRAAELPAAHSIVIIVARRDDATEVERHEMSLEDYYQNRHEVIDSDDYRRERLIVVIEGQLIDPAGKVFQEFRNWYGNDGN